MATPNTRNLPEIFRPSDARWASRASKRGQIRRLARGLYTRNLDERLVRRRWYDIAALYFPGAVVVDRSAVAAGPTDDGSLFLDIGTHPVNPRPVALAGLVMRPRNGPGPVPGDTPFVQLFMASCVTAPARSPHSWAPRSSSLNSTASSARCWAHTRPFCAHLRRRPAPQGCPTTP